MIRISNVRKTTKFKRSVKAISPVIATLLMIAIAVVASLVVYAWVSGYIGGSTSKAGNAIQIQSFASSGGNLVVYVQNVGQGAVELKPDQSVYVNGDLVPITNQGTGPITIAEGQTVELQTGTPYSGEKVNIKVTTTGGTFTQSTGTGSSNSSPNPTNNQIQYQIVVTQTANGVIAPDTSSYNAGSTPSFTITPDSGYHIASVTTNAGAQALTSPYVFPALSADETLTATFAINTYTITVAQTANGVIAPGTGTVNYGATPTYTITPNSGYHIASITANGGSVTVTTPAGQSYPFSAVSADGSLTATFAANTFGNNVQSGSSSTSIENNMAGGQFACSQSGTAQSITAYVIVGQTHTIKAAIYTTSGNLVGSTTENSVTTSNDGWVTFSFSGTKPSLTSGTSYIIVVWANNPSGYSNADLYYSGTSGGTPKTDGVTYGTWPNSATFTTSGNTLYSIYCTYSIP